MTQAFTTGILTESKMCSKGGNGKASRDWEDSRKFSRNTVDFTLVARPIRRPERHGRITDISERGLQVVGLSARVGKSAQLEIVSDWRSNEPPVFVEAACRWSNGGIEFPGPKAGFEVMDVKRGDFCRLLEDVSPLSLSQITPADSWSLPQTHEAEGTHGRFGISRSFDFAQGLEGKISRVRFFKFLDILTIPCLLIDRKGEVIHVNSYSATINPILFRIEGRPLSSLFLDQEGPTKVKDASTTQAVVQSRLRIEGTLLDCRLESRMLGNPENGHLLVFLKPLPVSPATGDGYALFGEDNPAELPDVNTPTVVYDASGLVDAVCSEMSSSDGVENHPLKSAREKSSVLGYGGPDPGADNASVEHYPVPSSKVMQDVLEKCRVVAKADTIVLLLGESGSGKDYLARFIHNHSSRSHAPFRSMNCAAIPQHLAESEFFGHEEGAFTGADLPKQGILEMAPGGTLLLNEIGELPLTLQAKLLSFLDTGRFFRVGGQSELSVDSRILAATNQDLKNEVRRGSFRADLFYRLNVVPIRVPSLRERIEDFPVLIEGLIAELARRLRLSAVPTMDRKTLSNLQAYHWPGNVRELKNRLERSLSLSNGKKISLSLMFSQSSHEQWGFNLQFPAGGNLNSFKVEATRRLISEALVRANGKRQVAAKLLGITRYALKRHMTNLGLIGNENG